MGAVEGRDGMVHQIQLLVVEGGRVAAAFAARHRLHPTDVEALLHVMVAQERGRPLTPGGLGTALGLTSGAVTSVLDRLERAGHLVRVRDDADRRRVLLHRSEAGRDLAQAFFEPLGRRTDAVMDAFTDEDLAVVHRFLGGAAAAMAEHRASFEREADGA